MAGVFAKNLAASTVAARDSVAAGASIPAIKAASPNT
jgi:hypothetical protein